MPGVRRRTTSRTTSSTTARPSRTTSCCARARSSCRAPTSPTGRSTSSTPGWSRRSASACAACATSSRTRRCSSPTTRTCSPTPRSTTWSRRSASSDAEAVAARGAPAGGLPHRRRRPDDRVNSIYPVTDMRIRENGGYFALRPRGDRLHPRERRPRRRRVHAPGEGGHACSSYPYDGFWQPADTLKERNALEAAYRAGTRPWMVWEREPERTPLEGLVEREPLGSAEADARADPRGPRRAGPARRALRRHPARRGRHGPHALPGAARAARAGPGALAAAGPPARTRSAPRWPPSARARTSRSPCSTCPTAACPTTGSGPRRRSRRSAAPASPTSCSPGTAATTTRTTAASPVSSRRSSATTWRSATRSSKPSPTSPSRRCCWPLEPEVVAEKSRLLHEHYPSQVSRAWFDDETFSRPRPHPRGAGRRPLRGGLPPDAGAARAPPYRRRPDGRTTRRRDRSDARPAHRPPGLPRHADGTDAHRGGPRGHRPRLRPLRRLRPRRAPAPEPPALAVDLRDVTAEQLAGSTPSCTSPRCRTTRWGRWRPSTPTTSTTTPRPASPAWRRTPASRASSTRRRARCTGRRAPRTSSTRRRR